MRLLIALTLLLPCCALAQSLHFQTTVAPRPEEDLAGDCHYELEITNPARPVRAVWVIFDRGRDMLNLYSDADVQIFAQRLELAMLLPRHCKAKDSDDMDMDPSKGVGRALFTALDQLAKTTNHPELSRSKLIVLGFSGAGSLTARMPGYAPGRLLAAVLADPGHSDPLGIDTVELSPQAVGVPQLILTGGADTVCGTDRPYRYFRKYRERGAPWAFVIQNKTPHCCIVNAKSLILTWLEGIIDASHASASSQTLHAIDQREGWLAFMTTDETDVKDTWGQKTSEVVEASIEPARTSQRQDRNPAGWLPSRQVAEQWLSFIRQPEHPLTSLP